ncbi:MAG: heme oxygenase [Pseudanabaena sp.]|nr:MAG: heme oxygenase [Pseudanabaena sp.]
MSQGLATLLRVGTQKSHSAAESTDFIKCFLKGVVDKTSYSRLVGNLYFVYQAIEAEFEVHKNDPVLSKLYYRELWREKSLELDMLFYFGSNWRESVKPTPACVKYLERIREISANDPVLLVAHAYTRYMGDLSGGQILKKIAKESMGLEEGSGTAFYEFDDIRNHGEFKKNYRQALDTLPIDAATADRIVEEANASFHMNMAMFRELEGNWLLALTKFGWNSLVSKFKGEPKQNSVRPASKAVS